MNITIIYGGPFPYGEASANRIISYSREIVRLGHYVQVHCLVTYLQHFNQNEKEQLPQNNSIDYLGIDCRYTSGLTNWPKGRAALLKKSWIYIQGCLNSARLLYKNRKSTDALLLSGSEIHLYIFYHFISRLCGLKLVVERSELPDIYKKKEILGKTLKGRLYTSISRYAFRKVDGWLLETQTLANYYMKLAKPDATLCIVPMTVELERFVNCQKAKTPDSPYIAYCGNMQEADGLSILIQAFALIAPKYPSYKMLLAGDSADVPNQKNLVNKLGLTDRVKFLGRISRDEIPSFIGNANLLALASPTSERSTATMPCKVGEYLATGNPVVVTNLGEIPTYLQDGISAYLAKPDSDIKFSEKLDEALSDYQRSQEIGERGKEVSIKEFNSQTLAKRIIDYFACLNH